MTEKGAPISFEVESKFNTERNDAVRKIIL